MPKNSKHTLQSIACENAKKPLHVRQYASAQYLCALSYLLSEDKETTCLPILREDGSYQPYQIVRIPLKEEMVVTLLLPEDKSAKEVKIIFRGTDPSNLKSHLINLDPFGPGYDSFQQEKNHIFKSLHQALCQHYGSDFQQIHLDIAGHSQGGSFAQLMTTEFLKRRHESSLFDGIHAIQMSAFNSPGVAHSVANDANLHLLYQLASKPLKVRVNYGMVDGDPIQMTGLDMILAKLPFPIVEVQLMKVNKGKSLQNIHEVHDIHNNPHFGAPIPVSKHGLIKEKYPSQFYSNKNKKDISPMIGEIYNKLRLTQHLFFAPRALFYYAAMGVDYLLKKANCSVSSQRVNTLMDQRAGIYPWFNYYRNMCADSRTLFFPTLEAKEKRGYRS